MRHITTVEMICISLLVAVAAFVVGTHFPSDRSCSIRRVAPPTIVYYSSDKKVYRPGNSSPDTIERNGVQWIVGRDLDVSHSVLVGKRGIALNPLNPCTSLVGEKRVKEAEACFNDSYPGSGTDMRKRGDLTLFKP